jgi:small subunit ribosomal protein S8
MMTDPVADFLARIRNAQMVKHAELVLPSSKMKARIAEILQSEGYVGDVRVDQDDKQGKLHVTLKYDNEGRPVIEGMRRVSKPGLRVYKAAKDLPKVRGGMGMAVVSTSRGIMSDIQARKENVGGEVLCYVW